MDSFNNSGGVDFKKIWDDAVAALGHTTIIVTGKTGVGKSTLINAVFHKDVAETGVGKPITKGIKEYSAEDFPLSIIDTIGLELENFETIKVNLIEEITKRGKETDYNKHVNVCWYCINDGSSRIESAEILFLTELAKYVKIVVVLTQAYDKEDCRLLNEIEKQLYDISDIKVVKVVAQTKFGVPSYGLDKLAEITEALLPEAQKTAFANAQKVSIGLKVKRAHCVVAGSAVTAGGIGASPIPFSDAILLVPTQIGMLAGISAVMGLDFQDGFFKTLIASTLGPSALTLGGKAIVSGLLKLIPGIGSVAGGVISGTTAVALTTALGEAYIKVLEKMLVNNSKITPEGISEAMKEEWKKR